MAACVDRAALAALLLLLSLTPTAPVQASLPPVQCSSGGCTVNSASRVWGDRRPCRVAQVVYPRTEAELVAAVAAAVRNGSKVKVVSRWAHSIPKLVCPQGDSGTLISTRDHNSHVSVDAQAQTVTCDAGVQLQDLVRIAGDQYGLALPHAPYWGGLSIAGLLSTGAHGSGLQGRGSAVHDYVTAVRVVVPAPAEQGYAAVRTFTAADGVDFAAVKVSLGVLGAISQVTLQLQPLFKRNLTYELVSDAGLEARIPNIPGQYEFGDVAWFPSLGKALYRLDTRVTGTGDGAFDFIGFRSVPVATSQSLRAQDDLAETTRNSALKLTRATAQLTALSTAGFGLYNNRAVPAFLGYPVVGFNHRMQTASGCTAGPSDVGNPSDPLNQICVYDLGPEGVFLFQNSVSIPVTEMGAFVADVRRLLALRPLGLVELDVYNGLLLRFVKGASSALLGKPTADAVDVDFTFLRASDAATPRLDEDVLEEMEQMLVFKYGGVPHWGKNRAVAFAGVAGKYGARVAQFLSVKAELDPAGVFSSDWTDAVLGGKAVGEVKPFCALEGLCICSEDAHCAPAAGYFCRPGLVYQQARVCRFEG